ncbi:MAG TPA: hypothetical protein VH370_13045 [Humisphaera sp.]|jgi:hypothetical protein|nr:hypothetical protein [Humisphaera sp.]
MSLESIYRVISNAHKAASEANGGTADEKGVVDVLGGLTALVESRLQLHKRATVPAVGGVAAPSAAAPARVATVAPASPPPAGVKRQTPTQADDSYDLK